MKGQAVHSLCWVYFNRVALKSEKKKKKTDLVYIHCLSSIIGILFNLNYLIDSL